MFKIFTKKISEKSQRKSGFSLVEMLVAIGVFMSIMVIAVTSLISIIGANKKAQAIKSTIDSVTFAVENISRDMREGYNYNCKTGIRATGEQLDCSGGGTSVQYTNSSGDTIVYTFNGVLANPTPGILTVEDKSSTNDVTTDLISQNSGVNISNMQFYVLGADHENDSGATRTQPRVIITVSGSISVKGSNDKTLFNLQTSVSQRVRR